MALFDVVIIGGGPGGYNAAIRAGQLGMKSAVVEGRGALGGTCLNAGCIPSKALLHASEVYEAAATGAHSALGILGTPKLDLSAMMAQKDAQVATLSKGVEFLLRKNKVEYHRGWGRIGGAGKVIVRAEDESEHLLESRHIIIATGSAPTTLANVPIDGRRVIDSTGALALKTVPKSLIVIGAGVIGLELGSVWRRLGAEVTVVEYQDRILPGMDAEIASTVQRILAKQGIRFRLGCKVACSSVDDKQVSLDLETIATGGEESLAADVVLVAVGRRPFTDGLGLETVGLGTDAHGRIANQDFKTGADGVWVIGDVTDGPMLAHKAEDEAVACVELIAGKPGHVNYEVIPSVVYTRPEVAAVGQTEEQLKATGVAYKVGTFPFAANSRAKIIHESEGFVKVLVDATSDRVLGVHMVGPNVGEMISEYCLGMELSVTAEDVARTCHPHPTRAEALRQAAMAAGGWAMQA